MTLAPGSSARPLLPVLLLATLCEARTPEERAARHLESVRHRRPLLVELLRRMPKGGDLHMHLSGSIYAESILGWAARDGLCVDRATSGLRRGPCGSCERTDPRPPASCALTDQPFHDQLVDAWSMRNHKPAVESGHDRFFETFGRLSPALDGRVGDALAEIASRAAGERVSYVEVIATSMEGLRELAGRVGWDDDLARLRQTLLAAGMHEVAGGVRARLDADEARRDELLRCAPAPGAGAERSDAGRRRLGGGDLRGAVRSRPQDPGRRRLGGGDLRGAVRSRLQDPGCGVAMRYLSQIHRGFARELVFAELVLAFELAKADSRVVGLNMVMPEDWHVPMRDFDLHMRMLETLRPLYPGTPVSLHAGELAPGLVPPEGLRSHIRQSVQRGGAERIGHGVALMLEDDPFGLLKEMARRQVLVEVCLTSNEVILGVSGARHPLSVYLAHGVPVALATDDAGVARSDLTHELLRAVEAQGLGYRELKRMARNSLTHSFLPGKSLWTGRPGVRVSPCRGDDPSKGKTSPRCAAFLESSERARLQWRLERDLIAFERSF